MAFQNVFLLGDTIVEVFLNDTTYFSDVMTLGSTSPVFDGFKGSDEPMQVSVSSEGVITLSWLGDPADGSNGYYCDAYLVDGFTPEMTVRVQDPSAYIAASSAVPQAYCDDANRSDLSYTWDGSAGVYTLSPTQTTFDGITAGNIGVFQGAAI